MKGHVEQAQRNGFFINDLSLFRVETASLVRDSELLFPNLCSGAGHFEPRAFRIPHFAARFLRKIKAKV
jgi:hypothetical protein